VAESQPTEEELRRQLEEQLRQLRISDLVVQTIYTVSSLGYRRLSSEERDLDEARLAIDVLAALVPTLESSVRPDLIRDLNQVKANMQLAYAKAVAEGGGTAEESTPEEDSAPTGEE
jgi:hypothetical protein